MTWAGFGGVGTPLYFMHFSEILRGWSPPTFMYYEKCTMQPPYLQSTCGGGCLRCDATLGSLTESRRLRLLKQSAKILQTAAEKLGISVEILLRKASDGESKEKLGVKTLNSLDSLCVKDAKKNRKRAETFLGASTISERYARDSDFAMSMRTFGHDER